jgi:O-antigen ligase
VAWQYIQYPYGPLALIILGLLFWRPAVGIALFAAVYPLDPWAPRLPVPGFNTETVLLGTAAAVTLLRFGARIPPLRFSGPVLSFMLVMAVSFALAIPWAREIRLIGDEPAIWQMFKVWKSVTFSVVFFFVSYWWFNSPRERRRMLEAVSLGVLISATAGLLDLVLKIGDQGGMLGRAGGLQIDPNSLACALGGGMFVPLYLATQASDVGRAKRIFFGATYGLAFVVAVLSLSRGNYVAMVVAHVVYFALVSRTMLVATLAGLLLVSTVAYPLLPQAVRDRIEVTFSTGTGYRVAGAAQVEASTGYRLVLTRIAVDMIEESPIWGHGMGFFYFHVPKYGPKYGTFEVKDTHNMVLKIAVESGVIGLAVLGWLGLTVLLCGNRLWRSKSSERYLGPVLIASAIHVFIANLSVNAFIGTQDVSGYFWILYAISARAYVERFSSAEVTAPALAAAVPRWRRFSQRIPAAASQQ